MLKQHIEKLGLACIDGTRSIGRISIFFFQGIFRNFVPFVQTAKVMEQVWFIGAKSMFVIVLTAIFTGMVLGLQGYYTLVDFGSEASLGSAVAITLIRELGPVLSAIMIAARAGSAMAAEIGVMRISEQIDALETMDIHPVRFTFSPRLSASIISFPLLTAIFDITGIFGGFLSGVMMLGINRHMYMDKVIRSIELADVTGGFVKALAFGMIVSTMCCYKGFFAHLSGTSSGQGAKSISLATTHAVVNACILILVSDYIITFFLV
ncbi:ABC transporter permease [uncultured Desulfobacter sp.]|uniref:MlaE family ABC transporter permease n=1 Tax=uncultured Desulfobacter sp. TaxID=240139 RepID=UPI002AABFBAE|nr:ABC transporter permease [uncultured Desulfobacter sp.]